MIPRIQDRARLAGGDDSRREAAARCYRTSLSALIEEREQPAAEAKPYFIRAIAQANDHGPSLTAPAA